MLDFNYFVLFLRISGGPRRGDRRTWQDPPFWASKTKKSQKENKQKTIKKNKYKNKHQLS